MRTGRSPTTIVTVGAGHSAVPADQALHSLRHSRVLDVATVVGSSGSEALPVQRYPRSSSRTRYRHYKTASLCRPAPDAAPTSQPVSPVCDGLIDEHHNAALPGTTGFPAPTGRRRWRKPRDWWPSTLSQSRSTRGPLPGVLGGPRCDRRSGSSTGPGSFSPGSCWIILVRRPRALAPRSDPKAALRVSLPQNDPRDSVRILTEREGSA